MSHAETHDLSLYSATERTWTRGGCQEQFVPMEPLTTNLRRRAEELGISHAEAARRSGLSERRYGNYVSGRREPDLATLVRIAGALSTTPDILLAVSDAAPRSDEAVLRDRIVSASNGLGSSELKMLATMIEALAAARS